MLYSLPEGSHQKHGENDGKPWESGSEAVAKSDIYCIYAIWDDFTYEIGDFSSWGAKFDR